MQTPNAQGIMGALSQGQAPRQPAPSPNSASPMAGLGGVEDRVAAYRGNPAPLQQRYQMTQDLLDLLALQKIKSEKENAARSLQLQMAQHQAAEGDPGASTVAQQREKEVAQMVGGVAQQDGARKEAAMRQMMSGIAGAPGANAAAQPQAMAAGGIVGYSGETGSVVKDSDRPQGAYGLNFIKRILGGLFSSDPEEVGTISGDRRAFGGGARATPPASTSLRDPRSRSSDTQEWDAPGVAPDAPRVAPAPSNAPPATPAPAARPAPRPPAAPAATPAAAPAASSITAPNIPKAPDPEDAAERNRKRVQGEYALTDEERAIRDEGIAQLRRRLADRSDPEKNRMAGIMQALLAGSRGGPRNVGALTGFAEGSIAADRQQRLEREAAEKELQALLSTGRTERLAGVAAANTIGQQASQTAATREGNILGATMNEFVARMTQLTSGLNNQSQERIGAANNRTTLQVAEIQKATAAINAASQRADLTEHRRQEIIQRSNQTIATAVTNINKQFIDIQEELKRNLASPSLDPKRREAMAAQLAQLDRTRADVIEEATRGAQRLIDANTLRVTGVSN